MGLIDFAIPRKGKEHHLSPQQKAKITRQYEKNKPIIKNPQDYEKRSVSKKTARLLDSAALKVSKGKRSTVFIPKSKGEEIKILKGGIVRRRKGDYEIKVYPAGWRMLETADKLFAKKLKWNEYVTAQIGKNGHFHQTFTSKTQLLNYLHNWQPKDKKYRGRKDELIAQFSLVKVRDDPDYISGRVMEEFDEDEDFDEDE